MTIEELEQLARGASWCSAFGRGEVPGAISIASRDEWEALARACRAGEFGLPSAVQSVQSAVPEFEWLSEDIEPELAHAPEHAIRRIVVASLKGVASPWLALSSVDFTNAFRRAAAHTFVGAATEVRAGRPDMWCRVAHLYAVGRWPFGITAAGQLVVL